MTRRYLKVQEGYQAEFPAPCDTILVEGQAGQVNSFAPEIIVELGANKNPAIKCRILVLEEPIYEARNVDPDPNQDPVFGYYRDKDAEFWLLGHQEIEAFRWTGEDLSKETKLLVTMYYWR